MPWLYRGLVLSLCQHVYTHSFIPTFIGTSLFSYTKFVHKSMVKSETVLKVLITPAEPADGLVSTYVMLYPMGGGNTGSKASSHHLQRVLEVKVYF